MIVLSLIWKQQSGLYLFCHCNPGNNDSKLQIKKVHRLKYQRVKDLFTIKVFKILFVAGYKNVHFMIDSRGGMLPAGTNIHKLPPHLRGDMTSAGLAPSLPTTKLISIR